MEDSLIIRDLCKNYNNFCLNHVNLTIKKGTIMGFIGENGAGKSTTIKAMLNIIQKDKGSVTLLGKSMEEETEEIQAKEEIGVVMDQSHFHDAFKVKDINMIMSRTYRNWDKQLFYHYIEQFHIPKEKTMKEYSRGMTMKMGIAAALAHHPKMLILDEATSGLDPIVRNEILDLFLEYIQDEEHSILISSHITSDLERICDYITFIHNGTILLSQDKDEMIQTHRILKCSKEELKKISQKEIVRIKETAFGCEVLVHSNQLEQYRDFVMDIPTLEDIMLFYVKGGL